MAQINVEGRILEVPVGTTYQEVARRLQDEYPHQIVLVLSGGKYKELRKPIRNDETFRFVTMGETDGMRTYERSALMLLCKAAYDLLDPEVRVYARFSVNGGLYLEFGGPAEADEETLARLERYMHELSEMDIPYEKRNIHADAAREIFQKMNQPEKVRLLKYRRNSYINLYNLGDYTDYYYGYMVPSTGYVRQFELRPYHEGFLLLLPRKADPEHVAPFNDTPKLFAAIQDSERWSEAMGMVNVGEINDIIARGEISDLILMAEARQEKQIAEIAAQIAARPEVKCVMIAGPSSSGKTSFSNRLSVQLRGIGLKPHPIEVDNYFVDREFTPVDENGEYDCESLKTVDVEKFNRDMLALLAGERVELPTYNFKQGKQEYKGNYLQLGEDDILVIEGIHCLNDALSYKLPADRKFKIYISALVQTNIDEHNRIPSTDGRLIRRMIRDARTRGASARDTISRWSSVRRGEEKNIFPYQESADVVFNSSLVYEFSVMKSYAEQLLFGIPEDAPEYPEAKRLLKFFDYFLAVDSTLVPMNSLVKEFIGGSIFKV